MKTKRLLVLLSVMLISMLATSVALADSPIIHMVSAGGPDACTAFGDHPGCDANFSFNAIEYADGSVSGQFTDQIGHGVGGAHAVIDCLYVQGNEAWVSGVITQDTITPDHSLVGVAFSAWVKDNGVSANDPPDQISGTHIGDHAFNCNDHPDVSYAAFTQGQVVVK